ncbi:hypothetical protein GCM10007158_35060 [Vreelandella hamiltonii]|uniref:Uncharacterized protein n=1 Tax=Halomonas johnsoniae TaxID=502832 RepID=A0ABQ2WSM5_9GAMM|nr:hypothetical protein GCM10007158_35060 [Halomonas johnsoniae]
MYPLSARQSKQRLPLADTGAILYRLTLHLTTLAEWRHHNTGKGSPQSAPLALYQQSFMASRSILKLHLGDAPIISPPLIKGRGQLRLCELSSSLVYGRR